MCSSHRFAGVVETANSVLCLLVVVVVDSWIAVGLDRLVGCSSRSCNGSDLYNSRKGLTHDDCGDCVGGGGGGGGGRLQQPSIYNPCLTSCLNRRYLFETWIRCDGNGNSLISSLLNVAYRNFNNLNNLVVEGLFIVLSPWLIYKQFSKF